jgi:hypothetical protein
LFALGGEKKGGRPPPEPAATPGERPGASPDRP